jgi:hypothetical protein
MTPAYALGRPDNVLVPADDTVSRLIISAMCLVEDNFGFELPTTPQDVRITRIDVVRNLTFLDPKDIDPFFRGHQDRRPKWGKANHTYTGNTGTIGVDKGNKRRSVRMYDKHLESNGECGPEIVRWEAKLLSGALQNLGISSLPDLTPAAIEDARHEMWEWSRMPEQIPVGSDLGGVLIEKMNDGTATLGDAKAVLHEVLLDGHKGSDSTRSRNQRIIQRLGLAASQGSLADQQFVLTADYDTGLVTRN